MSNIRIEEKPAMGKTHTVEIYYDADIPVSEALATQINLGQNLQVKVLQEVQSHDDEWINVDKTLSTICQAENCKNPSGSYITKDSDLTEAAQIMSNNRISGLPVVNSVDNLVGIVTRTDITKALVAS